MLVRPFIHSLVVNVLVLLENQAGLVIPRVGYRLLSSSSYNVVAVEGSTPIEHMLSKISHYGLYAFMIVMPASGVAMGYYGGKGLPFFYTTIPGIVKTDENKASTGNIAKNVSWPLMFDSMVCVEYKEFMLRLFRIVSFPGLSQSLILSLLFRLSLSFRFILRMPYTFPHLY